MDFPKKLFGKGSSTEGSDSGTSAMLSEPHLTIARAKNEMQMRMRAAIGMWGMDTAAWYADGGTI